jgi:calcineurin-like phosphoesterase family protein
MIIVELIHEPIKHSKMAYFFTSDWHLFHKNIIKYSNRPFSSVEEMNEELVNRCNSVVCSSDVVIHNGDFSFGDKTQTREILKRLNGTWIFLLGDHDRSWTNTNTLRQIYQKRINGIPIIVCHWCMRTWPKSHYNSWHLYGHSHGKLPSIGKSMDIGVDTNDYYPYSFDDIRRIMKSKPDNPNLIRNKRK